MGTAIIGIIIRTIVCIVVVDDAKSRGMSAGWWGFGAWVSPILIGIIYLIVRKPKVELKTEKKWDV